MLANALVGLAFATPDGFRTVREELTRVRHRALELGPTNPRVVLMDAGMVFGTPPAAGGSQERAYRELGPKNRDVLYRLIKKLGVTIRR